MEAVSYYSRIDGELGSSFVDEIEAAIERARQFPSTYGRISTDLRRILIHRFSYAIVYETLADRILIWAIMHTSRQPDYWKERLKQ